MQKEDLDKFYEKFEDQLREIEEEMELIEKSQKKFVKGIKKVDEAEPKSRAKKTESSKPHDEDSGLSPDILKNLETLDSMDDFEIKFYKDQAKEFNDEASLYK